jgi:hypothetical protein
MKYDKDQIQDKLEKAQGMIPTVRRLLAAQPQALKVLEWISIGLGIAILALGLMGCVTYSEVTNDNNDRERGVDARVGSIDVRVPECPQPASGESAEGFAARLAAWERVGGQLADALAKIKMPESFSGITISDIWYWKDQRGTGGAETRAKGESSVDGAVGLGGSNVTKDGGSDSTETSGDEHREIDIDQGDEPQDE